MRTTSGTSAVAVALGLALGLAPALAGCGGEAQGDVVPAAAQQAPATVELDPAGGPARLVLSARAEERLGLATAPVAATPTGLAVPYAAVVYAADGTAWAFAAVSERTYQRVPITVAAVTDGQAQLSAGPAPGTPVVVVAAPELVGVEAGISGGE